MRRCNIATKFFSFKRTRLVTERCSQARNQEFNSQMTINIGCDGKKVLCCCCAGRHIDGNVVGVAT